LIFRSVTRLGHRFSPELFDYSLDKEMSALYCSRVRQLLVKPFSIGPRCLREI
jgi:hypothetical protein